MGSATPTLRKGKTGTRAVGVAKAIPPRPCEREVHAEIASTFCLWAYNFSSLVRNGHVRDTTPEALTAATWDSGETDATAYRTILGRRLHYTKHGPCAGPWAIAESPLHFAIAEVVYDRVVTNGAIDHGRMHDLKRCIESEFRGDREAIFARAMNLLERDGLTDHPGLRGWQLQTGGSGGQQRWKKNAGDPKKRRTIQAFVWWAGRNGWRWKVGRGSQTPTSTKYGRLSTWRVLAEGATLTRSAAVEECEAGVTTWADQPDDYATTMKARARDANLCAECHEHDRAYAHSEARWKAEVAPYNDYAGRPPVPPRFHAFKPYPGAPPVKPESDECLLCGREGTARANDNLDVCEDAIACAETVLDAEADAVLAAEEGDDDADEA